MIVLAGVGLALVVMAAMVTAYGSRPRARDRIAPYRGGSRRGSPGADGAVWSARPRAARAALMGLGRARLAERLRAAGRDESAAEAFRMRQFTLLGSGAAAGVVLGAVVLRSAPVTALLTLTGAAVGYTRAPARLARDAEERRLRMRLELATVDQILAIHVRAGAGPVQAVMRVVERGRGAVIDELRSILVAIRTGRSEAEAFRVASEQTAEPHAARTYRLFALACEQGADLGVALRALSDDLRDVRRDELRRQATRRRAAMLVPTIAVLAPIMLLFVVAPLPSIVLGGR